MKKKLIALILAAMSMTALAACGQKKQDQKPSGGDDTPVDPTPAALPAEYDLLNNWAGNENEEAYAVAVRDNKTVITYSDVTGEDAGGWEYVKRSFQYDTRASEFGIYKKILFTGKLEKTSGTNIVMIKVEGTDGNQFEKRFTFASEVKTYELGLNFITDWTKVSQLLFFVNRSTNESGSGVITLDKFVLSKAEVVPENDIAPGMPDVPQGYAYYNEHVGEAGKVDIMYHWGYSSDGHISAAEASGKYTFEWQGAKGEYEWVSSHIKNGDANLHEGGLKRLVFEVKGSVSHTAIFKFESEQTHKQIEKNVELTGEDQVVELDVTKVLVEGETSFMAMIMPDAGQNNVANKGQIVLAKCYLDKTEVTPEPQPEEPKNVFLYPHAWLDKVASSDNCYEIESNEETHITKIKFEHENAGENYRTIIYKLQLNDDWFGITNYRRVFAKVSADVDVQVLIKAYDKVEKRVDLVAGVAQYVSFEVEEADVNIDKPFVVFVGTSATSPKAGNVTIEGLRVARFNSVSEIAEGVAKIDAASGEGYTFSKNSDGNLEIEWEATKPDYRAIELFVSTPNAAALNTVKVKLTATENVHVLFKPADNSGNEQTVALTKDVERGYNRSFSAKALGDGWDSKFVLFICTAEGDALKGKVTFKDFRITDGTHDAFDEVTNDPDPDPEYMNYANYQSLYMDKVKFAPEQIKVENENHITTMSFTDLAPSWGNGVQYIGKLHSDISWANINDYSHFYAVVSASVEMKIMLKPFNDSALEQTISVGTSPITLQFDIPAEKLDFSKESVIFVNPEVEDTATVTGTLTIKYMQFARSGANIFDGEKVVFNSFSSAAQGDYSLEYDSSKNIAVSYQKAEAGWGGFELFFTGHDFANYNVMSGVINSEVDTEIKVKPFDANEQTIKLNAGDNTILFGFTQKNSDPMWGKLVIIAGYEGQPLTGKLTLKGLTLSHAEPITQPAGQFFGSQELAAGGKAPILVNIEETAATVNIDTGATVYNIEATIKSFDNLTGLLVLESTIYGEARMFYNATEQKIEKFGFVSAPASGLLKWNFGVGLYKQFLHLDCEGDAAALQAIFHRRYGSPWSFDTGNADRLVPDTEHHKGGNSGVKVRAWKDGRIAIAVKKTGQSMQARNISFWVYNPSEADITIQVFAYTGNAADYSDFVQVTGGTPAKANGWTYVSFGVPNSPRAITAFQVVVPNGTTTQLTFDDFYMF